MIKHKLLPIHQLQTHHKPAHQGLVHQALVHQAPAHQAPAHLKQAHQGQVLLKQAHQELAPQAPAHQELAHLKQVLLQQMHLHPPPPLPILCKFIFLSNFFSYFFFRTMSGMHSVTSTCNNPDCCCASGNVQVQQAQTTVTITLDTMTGNCDLNTKNIVATLSTPTSGTARYKGIDYAFSKNGNQILLSSTSGNSSCSFTFECVSGDCASSSWMLSVSFVLLFFYLFVSFF